MTILHSQCLCAEITAKPTGAPAVAGTLLLGNDCQFHALPAFPAAPAAQALTLVGQTLVLSGGGGSVTLPDLDTQDLSIVGNVISLTGGGSVTLPVAPVADGSETKLTAGTNVTVSGAGTTASPYVVAATTPTPTTPALTIVGNQLTIVGGNTVAIPAATPADGSETKVIAGANTTVTGAGTTASPYVVAAGAGASTVVTSGVGNVVSGAGTTGSPYVVTEVPRLGFTDQKSACPVVNFKPGLQNVGDVIYASAIASVTNTSAIYSAVGHYSIEFHSLRAITFPGSVYAIKSQVSFNGSSYSDLGDAIISNEAGSVAVNYQGSPFGTAVRQLVIAPGQTITIQSRIILDFKGALTAADEIINFCSDNSIVLHN